MKTENRIMTLLNNALIQRKLIGVNTPEINWDELIIGYITEINDDCIIINEVDEYGTFIGNTLIRINDILHICSDSRYIRDLHDLQNHNCIFNPNLRKTIWEKSEKLKHYLNELKENGKISTLFFEDDRFVIGIILEIDPEFCLIKNIGKNGKEEGLTCYRIDDIIGLKYDDLIMQKVLFLKNKSEILTP